MRAGYRDLSIRVTSSFVLMGCSCSSALCGQLVWPDTPPSGVVGIETTPLPASAARKITEIPEWFGAGSDRETMTQQLHVRTMRL